MAQGYDSFRKEDRSGDGTNRKALKIGMTWWTLAARRRSELLTYSGAGRTRTTLPPGYMTFARTRRRPGSTDFEEAADALMSWQVQARAGLRVAASHDRVVDAAICVMRFGPRLLALTIPCRVVYTIAEADTYERSISGLTAGSRPEQTCTVPRNGASRALTSTRRYACLPIRSRLYFESRGSHHGPA